MPSKTLFGLLRHAETEWNRQKRIQGQQDAPLTPEGRASAEQWGRLLAPFKWERLLVSDLGRAMQTAASINASLGLELHVDAGLREQDWGDWTGREIKELQDREAERLAVIEAAGWDFAPPGGESRRQVLERSSACLQAAARSWPGRRTLVVCHEGVIKCLIYHLCGRRFLPDEGALLRDRHLHLLTVTGSVLELDRINVLDLKVPQ